MVVGRVVEFVSVVKVLKLVMVLLRVVEVYGL